MTLLADDIAKLRLRLGESSDLVKRCNDVIRKEMKKRGAIDEDMLHLVIGKESLAVVIGRLAATQQQLSKLMFELMQQEYQERSTDCMEKAARKQGADDTLPDADWELAEQAVRRWRERSKSEDGME